MQDFMKKDWIDEFDAICKALNEQDLMGLIDTGAPEDEYEIEALEIFLQKKEGKLNNTNAVENIRGIFQEKFWVDVTINEGKLDALSKAILALK